VKSEVYVPVLCSSCLRGYLLRVVSGEGLNCRACGGPASVVPSEIYGETDIPLFERVSAAVQSDLTALAARKVLAELQDARGRSEALEAVLLRIVDDLPGLHFLIPAAYPKQLRAEYRAQMARGLAMVFTLVSARLPRFQASPLVTNLRS
jgi:hypothetical protein